MKYARIILKDKNLNFNYHINYILEKILPKDFQIQESGELKIKII